jgi:CopA family copper-resistance protein
MNLLSEQEICLSRRRFVLGLAMGGALTALGLPSKALFAAAQNRLTTLRGNKFQLNIGSQTVNFTGTPSLATTVNGSLPAPILRWREGDEVTLNVTNRLAVTSSIHWHGIILPNAMDGVPGMTFDGIKPGETFIYRFKVQQSGTYWYHSHSGFQEQTGLYGAIVIDPKTAEPFTYDRDYVVMLSDWTDENPHTVYAKLKKASHYYNFNERTVGDLWQEIREKGIFQAWNDRKMWNNMRMSDRDISDVTGYSYTFLMNGNTPADGWKGLFKRGDKVRLRIINSSAMTFFDVRIPGLKMTVVAADGQYVEPVSIDEFRIGVAETYDVIVEPKDDRAYTIFAQAIDRSGYARGTLTPDLSLTAPVPKLDPVPVLNHADMGMGSHSHHAGHKMPMKKHDAHHAGHQMPMKKHHAHHAGHQMPMKKDSMQTMVHHAPTEYGPHVDMRAENPQYRLNDPGVGLRHNGRRVLTYADLRNLHTTPDPREPKREIELHLTGNMHRYMWSINGVKFADAEPLHFKYGERLRITLVNDTMMNHPIHLHGLWSDLETGDNQHIPRKHTVIVQPGSKISYRVTADAKGRWAYHCHLLYHMSGMFREVIV